MPVESGGGLSQEEFLRVQEQIIELRNRNYELQEELRKKNSELANIQSPKKDAIQFATKLITRGKDKMQEKLEGDLEGMRRKLAMQEEEFRLQQNTLLEELNKVVQQSSSQEQEIERLKAQLLRIGVVSVPNESPVCDSDDSPSTSDPLHAASFSTPTECFSDLPTASSSEQEKQSLAADNVLQGKLIEAQEQLETVRLELQDKDVLLKALETQLLDYKARFEETVAYSQQSLQELHDLQNQMKQTKAEMERTSDEYKTREQELLARCSAQESRVSVMVAELDTAQKQLQENSLSSLAESDRFGTELSLKCAEVDALSEKCTLLEASLKDAQKESSFLRDSHHNTLAMKDDELQKQRSEILKLERAVKTIEKDLHSERKKHELALAEIHRTAEADRFNVEQLQKNGEEVETKFQNQLDEIHRKHEMELRSMEKQCANTSEQALLSLTAKHEEACAELRREIDSLREALRSKDAEKAMALKKQAALLKELKHSLGEERKRADASERANSSVAEQWTVVAEPDVRSQTVDGNDSVSSLSVLESDNVELITRLTKVQRELADTVDRMNALEIENNLLRREVGEKNELIEHWIRTRGNDSPPQHHRHPAVPSQSTFRNLLTSAMTDPAINDVRDMNRRLQRMLEEALSKNISLQRDLQTLLERTEM